MAFEANENIEYRYEENEFVPTTHLIRYEKIIYPKSDKTIL